MRKMRAMLQVWQTRQTCAGDAALLWATGPQAGESSASEFSNVTRVHATRRSRQVWDKSVTFVPNYRAPLRLADRIKKKLNSLTTSDCGWKIDIPEVFG